MQEEAQSCLSAARDLLSAKHLVVVRSHLAVVRAAQGVIACSSSSSGGGGGGGGGPADPTAESCSMVMTLEQQQEQRKHEAAIAALRSCVAITQSDYLPATHHERATTAADTQSLLGYLLSVNPELLHTELAAEGYGTFSLASRAEFAAKQRAEALQALYENEAGDDANYCDSN